MAESVDDVNDQCSDISADSEVKNTKIYKFFKCCTKKTCSTLICKNCGGAYHDSCARKLVNKTGLSFLDATYVKCCEMEELIYNSNGGRENEIESNQSVNIRLKEENIKMRYEKQILQAEINHLKYLLNEQKENKERLLNEMNDKNLILRENNRSMMERITQMQTEIPIVNINSSQEKNRPTINIEKRENISLSKAPIILKDDKPNNQMSSNRLKNVTYSSIMSTTSIQQVSTSSLQASRKDTSNVIIDHIAVNQSLSNISQTTLEYFITHLKCESQNWGVLVNNVKIIKDHVHFYFKKPLAFCKTIHDCLSMGQSYGAIEQGPKVLFHIFNEEQYCDNSAEMNLTYLRLITLKKVAQKFTEFKLNPLQDSNIIEMKLTTKRNSDTDILCGDVLKCGKKDTTTSAEELIRKRSVDISVRRYGRGIQYSGSFKEYFDKLGAASVTIELLYFQPDENIKVSLKGPNSINKCPSFIFYNCARLSTLLKEFEKRVNDGIYPQLTSFHNVDFSLLNQPEEWELLNAYIMPFPFEIRSCIQDIDKGIFNPQFLIYFLYNMCYVFSAYLRRIRIFVAPKKHLIPTINARIYLLRSLENVFHKSLELLNIDPIEE